MPKGTKYQQVSIGRDVAIDLAKTEFWKEMTPRQIAEYQMQTEELCVPFDVFQEAVETTLGRPVFTHEFALNFDGIMSELRGECNPPTLQEIVNMIPADKRFVVAVI